jgi:hypothetical protein
MTLDQIIEEAVDRIEPGIKLSLNSTKNSTNVEVVKGREAFIRHQEKLRGIVREAIDRAAALPPKA